MFPHNGNSAVLFVAEEFNGYEFFEINSNLTVFEINSNLTVSKFSKLIQNLKNNRLISSNEHFSLPDSLYY